MIKIKKLFTTTISIFLVSNIAISAYMYTFHNMTPYDVHVYLNLAARVVDPKYL